MSNPYMIQRRANAWGDLEQTFHVIDAKRLEWLAGILAECDRPTVAEAARRWALEHRETADKLAGAGPVGAVERVPA